MVSTYVHNEDLVECVICFSLVTRDHRPLHLEWHAKQAAKIFNILQQLKEFELWLTSKEFEK